MKRFSVREAILVAIAVSLTVLVSTVWSRWHVPKLDTPYQAVLLTNNTVYIGRLQGFGTPYPVMRDVFYIQTRVNPETKQAGNALVRRETTWHSPTYMILDEKQIVMIEPVGKYSRVAELINENPKQ
jgi:hypothetical protein